MACLCAQWCRTCDSYRATLASVQAALRADFGLAAPQFTWVDIEDEAELVGDLDIQDFPTLLLARDAPAQPVFFGPLPPHAQTLERLVRGALAGELPAAVLPAEVHALAQRLRGRALP